MEDVSQEQKRWGLEVSCDDAATRGSSEVLRGSGTQTGGLATLIPTTTPCCHVLERITAGGRHNDEE